MKWRRILAATALLVAAALGEWALFLTHVPMSAKIGWTAAGFAAVGFIALLASVQ
jgi:uncharacterized membrane protein YcjF (UPF0283 family)